MRQRGAQSGFMLLEVVLAVGLLVLGLSVIGAQVQQSYFLAHDTDTLARVVFLAESKLAEIDTGLIDPEKEIEEEFGRLFPQYGWRLTMEPIGLPDMFLLTLEILHDPLREAEQDFEYRDAQVVADYRFVKLAPRPLDLTTDFGMDEDTAADLNERLADIGGEAIDVHDFNPALFRDMDMEQILQVLPALMEAFGVNQTEILKLVPENLRPQVEQLFETPPDEGDTGDGDDGQSDDLEDDSMSGAGPGDEAGSAGGDQADDGSDTTASEGDDDQNQPSRSGTPQRPRRRPPRSGGGGS